MFNNTTVLSFIASGASFTGFIVIIIIAVSHKTGEPVSHTVYVIVSIPLKFVSGSYVISPVTGSTLDVPLLGPPITVTLVLSNGPSKSVSFTSGSIITVVSSPVTTLSFTANGGLFPVTTM